MVWFLIVIQTVLAYSTLLTHNKRGLESWQVNVGKCKLGLVSVNKQTAKVVWTEGGKYDEKLHCAV